MCLGSKALFMSAAAGVCLSGITLVPRTPTTNAVGAQKIIPCGVYLMFLSCKPMCVKLLPPHACRLGRPILQY
ncbi:hypothetical protein F5Y18DRAFT_383621 [Xylariaceae sp. FL1019]|nr:hypothetical protein F5Y18DRAFT_383621 [Xylariaceae sp. FL1019]